MSGKLVKIDCFGKQSITKIEHSGPPTWDELNKEIGGYIERVRVKYEGKMRDAYVDEEGLLKDLPYNPIASKLVSNSYSTKPSGYVAYIVGPLVIWVPEPKVSKNVQTSPRTE